MTEATVVVCVVRCTALNSVVAPISIFFSYSVSLCVFNRDCNRSAMMAWFLALVTMHRDRLPFESRMLNMSRYPSYF